MGDQRNGGIGWTDETWNCLRGCDKVTQGCKFCYAEVMAARFSKPGQPYADVITDSRWNGTVAFIPEKLFDPVRWQRPRRIFVNSMSDVFHASVSNRVIAAIFGIAAATQRHTHQILTKRAARMREWFKWFEAEAEKYEEGDGAMWGRVRLMRECVFEAAGEYAQELHFEGVSFDWPLRNVWLGVSAENQTTFDDRVALLLQCPARVRWVSLEPLLGDINMRAALRMGASCECGMDRGTRNGCQPKRNKEGREMGWIRCNAGTRKLDWVVVGGESGAGSRPTPRGVFQSVRDQCADAGVPFMFKQHGDLIHSSQYVYRHPVHASCEDYDGELFYRVGKKTAGRLLDGVTHDGYPLSEQVRIEASQPGGAPC